MLKGKMKSLKDKHLDLSKKVDEPTKKKADELIKVVEKKTRKSKKSKK